LVENWLKGKGLNEEQTFYQQLYMDWKVVKGFLVDILNSFIYKLKLLMLLRVISCIGWKVLYKNKSSYINRIREKKIVEVNIELYNLLII